VFSFLTVFIVLAPTGMGETPSVSNLTPRKEARNTLASGRKANEFSLPLQAEWNLWHPLQGRRECPGIH
jgi:hypothetical protein